MAIDDNTSYELTGAQVKDLANKIKAKAADNIFVGATSAIPGSKGLVPQPQAGDDTKFLSGDGTWKTAGGGGSTYTAGDGIDITGNVISATNTGLAKILTTDDYNWNSTAHDSTTTPFDCVALWLLPEGYYYNKNQVDYVQYASESAAHHWRDAFIIGPKGQTYRRILKFDYADNIIRVWTVSENGGSSGGNAGILTSADVINNLVTTSNSKPLSATQGKTLKDLIDSLVVKNAGAPTTSTAGTVGKLYEDTTNGKLYICTDATNPYVWEEVGGSSSGSVTTLYANTPAPRSAIYSDQAKTTAVTTQEILDAFDNSTVYLVISPYEKYMLVNRYFDSTTNYAEFIFAGDRQIVRYTMQGLSSTMANGSTVNMQTELSPFDGATSSADGSEGLVPAPVVGDQDKYLKGDGTWSVLSSVKINPKFMQTGTGSITYQTQGSGGGGVNVTFDTPFDHTPVVVASTKGPYSANAIEVHVQSPSTTGFAILARTAGSSQETGNFQWVAIDPLAEATVGVTADIEDGSVTPQKLDGSSFVGTTDANGWAIQYLPSGKRIWTKSGMNTLTVSGSSWSSFTATSLPSDISSAQDWALSGSCDTSDSAVACNFGRSADTLASSASVTVRYQNVYAGSINNVRFRWSFAIIEN